MLGFAQMLAHSGAGKIQVLSRPLRVGPGHRKRAALLPEQQPFTLIPRWGLVASVE